MEKGYIENGFIVDLSDAKRTSEMIYELSKILDIPEAKGKNVCLKLGDTLVNQTQLISIKALIDSMDSVLECISSTNEETMNTAAEMGINLTVAENKIEAPVFEEPVVSTEIETALDKIFGDEDFEASAEVEELNKENQPEAPDFTEEETNEEIIAGRKEAESLPTVYVHRNVRSGQNITSDGNLLIVGDVNPGAEVIAKGDITVWGVLGGIAQAGCEGNNYARIRALKMNAIQLRIGDHFARRPDSVNVPFVQKSNEFTPEEARVNKNHIVIFKMINN